MCEKIAEPGDAAQLVANMLELSDQVDSAVADFNKGQVDITLSNGGRVVVQVIRCDQPEFYFIAQTGLVLDRIPKVSNYYPYRLPGHMRSVVENAVSRATGEMIKFGRGDLCYTKEFLDEILLADLNARGSSHG